MAIIDSYIVTEEQSDQRLYDVAYTAFSRIIPSRKGIKKAIKRKCLLVDGAVGDSGWKLKSGQKIDLLADYSKVPKIYELEIPIIYEDEQVAVVNKPAGIIVSGNEYRTLYNALGYNLEKSTAIDALPYPTPCHRLDKATSGCVLVAKTKSAQIALGNQFAKKEIKKEYIAIVHGEVENEGTIDTPINGQEALTHFSVLEKAVSKSGEVFSFLSLQPQTGRTHQLRIHLSSLGHPILGDKLYGTEGNILLHKGLFLCAKRIHATVDDKLIKCVTSTPNKFTRIWRLLKK